MIGKIPLGGGNLIRKRRIQFVHTYDDIISLENLLEAWKEFIKGKRSRKDVQIFERNLMSEIISLHYDLVNKIYRHSLYEHFKINDPKPRDIHKASVRDRLLHHAIYRKLYPFFDRAFISDSFSCRLNKGTHKALNRFRDFSRKESKNHMKTVFVLKCDIRKFFASIDHGILINILDDYINDKNLVTLLKGIVGSFSSGDGGVRGDVGLPLGNLTSQLFVNIYMNKFDQFMKHKIEARYYIRYADDFVIFSQDKKWLENLIGKITDYLWTELRLKIHPNKISIKTINSGVDYLGWIHFRDHRILRTKTRQKMLRNLANNDGGKRASRLQSYLGLLGHGNSHKITNIIKIPNNP